ncbi:MAG: hypothetical protein Q8O88_04025 [bacterium]|nr:hypothetical protein [bacterium]
MATSFLIVKSNYNPYLCQMNFYTKRLIVFLRCNWEYAFFFPLVIIHELSHYIFVLTLHMFLGIKMDFRIMIDGMGFFFKDTADMKDKEQTVGLSGALIFTLASIAPIIPFVFCAYHLLDVLVWDQLVGIYLALGLRILLPSEDDFDSFLILPKEIIK